MAASKRMSERDVTEIFASLHEEGREPPPYLPFQIVPVGAKGLKLSPPSYEFRDGLYVLLAPQKKTKHGAVARQPSAPSHLERLVMTDLPAEHCPWSLSGPQFSGPTTVQQRYCYPKGRHEYASRTGGALWTMLIHGKENHEYRLLHVYTSHKRAANNGITLPRAIPATVPRSVPSRRVPLLAHFRPAPISYGSSPVSFSFDTMSTPSHAFHSNGNDSGSTLALRRSDSDIDYLLPMHELENDWDLPLFLEKDNADDRETQFIEALESFHQSLREYIQAAPFADQDTLIHHVMHWANNVADHVVHHQQGISHEEAVFQQQSHRFA
jgi:hypothetical protein